MNLSDSTIRELANSFLSLIEKIRLLDKIPRRYGTDELFYTSELVAAEMIGYAPGINITELAQSMGITKGGVSQLIKKLEKKGLVIRFQDAVNKKKVHLKLSMKGEIVFHQHQLFHLKYQADIGLEMSTWSEEQMQFAKHLLSMFQRLTDALMKDVTGQRG